MTALLGPKPLWGPRPGAISLSSPGWIPTVPGAAWTNVLPGAFTGVSNAMKYLEKIWAPRTETLSVYIAGFNSGRAWQ